MVFKLDSEGKFYFVSSEYKRMFDYGNDEMNGIHFSSVIHPDDLPLAVETFHELEKFGKASSSINFRVRHKSGSYKWVNCSAVCLYEDGNPSRFIGMAHDVSRLHDLLDELRASETALKISEERYRSLFDALGEGAVLVNKEGTVIAVNRCAEKIFEIDTNKMVSMNVFVEDYSYIHEDGSPFPPETHPSIITLRTGQPYKDVVIGIQKPNGKLSWISLNTEPIYYTENRERPDAVVASFSDITQARNDRAELIRNQQLLALESERYVRAMKTVAEAVVDAQEKERADIAFELHDNVSQILSTVRLYLDLAIISEKDRVPLLQRSSTGLANAVNEINKLSHSLVPSSVNDLGLVASIDDMINSLQHVQRIKAEFYHAGNVEVMSEKHKRVLFRIIQEQVTNVLKHAEASSLTIELVSEPSSISLTISDDGKGVDRDSLKYKKGVGLYNIANRAELFNGKLSIITSPGEGFRLNVLIPI